MSASPASARWPLLSPHLNSGKVDAAIVLPYPLASLRRRHPDLVVLAEMITAGGMAECLRVGYPPEPLPDRQVFWLEAAESGAQGRSSDGFDGRPEQLHIPEQIRDKLPTSARLEDAPAQTRLISPASRKPTPRWPDATERARRFDAGASGSVEKLRESTFDFAMGLQRTNFSLV